MPPAKKRKLAAATDEGPGRDANLPINSEQSPPNPTTTLVSDSGVVTENAAPEGFGEAQAVPEVSTVPNATADVPAEPTTSTSDRMARFRALQARAKSSLATNLKAATQEAQRQVNDPSQLTAVHRKHAIASQKLLKADIEESGGDFERKRAWDWTIDESEAWDKRQAKKEAHRDDTSFQDYRREGQKVYKRQLKSMGEPDLEAYAREKMKAVEKAAAEGTLEIVETEDGEMIAVDKDGTFYATADSTSVVNNKPDKAAVDRLVAQMNKADEAAMKKRKERMNRSGKDADVTYINEKNKVFNERLSRFYNKYTKEIRDSFERGTMI